MNHSAQTQARQNPEGRWPSASGQVPKTKAQGATGTKRSQAKPESKPPSAKNKATRLGNNNNGALVSPAYPWEKPSAVLIVPHIISERVRFAAI